METTGSDGYLISVYVTYALVSISLIAWLAHTLFKNGAVFLRDVFHDRAELADSVNRLLVIGFYLMNLGYAFLLLRSPVADTAVDAIEALTTKLGALLVSLAVLHFANLFVFYKIRERSSRSHTPPVRPQTRMPNPVPNWMPPPAQG